ncbi:hypothetical protein WL15_22855 [Burkholderia multivorans]|nr:hypothetical protein WL15_22855 [Burkholderia multivorans]
MIRFGAAEASVAESGPTSRRDVRAATRTSSMRGGSVRRRDTEARDPRCGTRRCIGNHVATRLAFARSRHPARAAFAPFAAIGRDRARHF